MSLPPGPRLLRLAQAAVVTAAPYAWMAKRRERYGDVFSSHFPFFGRVVYVADPALVKEVFTGDPQTFHAGEANATVLEFGCNDGVLLRPLADQGIRTVIGVDPASNVVATIDDSRVKVVNDYFTQDVARKVVADYGKVDLIMANNVRHVVTWNQKDDVSALAGKPIRLKITLRSAKLYGFQFS